MCHYSRISLQEIFNMLTRHSVERERDREGSVIIITAPPREMLPLFSTTSKHYCLFLCQSALLSFQSQALNT